MSVTITFQKKHFLMMGLIIAIPFLFIAITNIFAAGSGGQFHDISEIIMGNLDMQGKNITNVGNISITGGDNGLIFPDGTIQKTAISLAVAEGNFLKGIVPVLNSMNNNGDMLTETNNMTDRDGTTYAWATIYSRGYNRGGPTSASGTVIFNLPRPTYIEKINIRGTATNPHTAPNCPNYHRTRSYCCSTSNSLQVSSDGITYRTLGTIGTNEYDIFDNIKSIKLVISGSCDVNSYGQTHTMKIYETKAY